MYRFSAAHISKSERTWKKQDGAGFGPRERFGLPMVCLRGRGKAMKKTLRGFLDRPLIAQALTAAFSVILAVWCVAAILVMALPNIQLTNGANPPGVYEETERYIRPANANILAVQMALEALGIENPKKGILDRD
jgi:hypothetical protein